MGPAWRARKLVNTNVLGLRARPTRCSSAPRQERRRRVTTAKSSAPLIRSRSENGVFYGNKEEEHDGESGNDARDERMMTTAARPREGSDRVSGLM